MHDIQINSLGWQGLPILKFLTNIEFLDVFFLGGSMDPSHDIWNIQKNAYSYGNMLVYFQQNT